MVEIFQLPFMKILPRINEHTDLSQAGTVSVSIIRIVPGEQRVKKVQNY
jgi:hypothetical protein